MTGPPQLRHLDIGELVAAAGGDPWQVNTAIQSGSPGEISELASAFYNAGQCMGDTSEEFNAAKTRFEAAWDHDDGGAHPINDSAEVRRATELLHLNREQLTRVAVDLENIAASLAEAQRSGEISLGNLNGMLQTIDNQIDREIAMAAAEGKEADWSELKQAAVDRTKHALQEMQAIRDAYADKLDQSRLEMTEQGYTPEVTHAADGQGGLTPDEQARAEADKYSASQRATDEALVNSPGPWTPEKQAAAGRLRDFGTITDPNADPAAVRYAGERLDDYLLSRYAGPLPTDPLMGGDARTRAQNRLLLQHELEAGFRGMSPMSADAATAMLDRAEAQTRMLAVQRAQEQLKNLGVSDDGIQKILKGFGSFGDSVGTGIERYGESVPTGKHALDGLSKADAEALSKLGGRIAKVGNVMQLVVAIDEWRFGGDERWQKLGEGTGSLIGSMLGGAEAGAAVGSFAGPYTAAGAAVIGGLLGGFAGEDIGGGIGSMFDPVPVGAGGKSW